MALHEQSVGATDEWYTPGYVFEAMGVRFDYDAAPGPEWTPARSWCDGNSPDGLKYAWPGFTWLNPPFGGRNGLVPWLDKFFRHGNGVALVPDRTSAPWWQTYAPKADAVLFASPKIRFLGEDGQPGRSPAQGTTLLAAGEMGALALRKASHRLGPVFYPSANPERRSHA